MSNRKNYNSIVFLTTLGVYLGLVLAGGVAPSVLAQAATTRDFDIKSEIVVEDDLDKKPDEKDLATYVSLYRELYKLAKDFKEKNRESLRGDYEFNCSVFFQPDLSKTVQCRGGKGLFSGVFIPPIENVGKLFPHNSDAKSEKAQVNLILSDSDFFLKTSLTQDSDWQAKQFAEFYNNSLSKIKLQQLNNPQITFYQNTQITFENNQVFIVTRLPRGSIDSLSAEKDAR